MEYIDDAMTQIAQINKQIANYVDEYVRFMGIKHFPTYDLKFKKVSLSKADSQGFDSLASTAYDVNVNNHTLCIAANLPLAKYVLFHEFTHMLDSEEHTDGNKNRYILLKIHERDGFLGIVCENSFDPQEPEREAKKNRAEARFGLENCQGYRCQVFRRDHRAE